MAFILTLAGCAPIAPAYRPPAPELPAAWQGATATPLSPTDSADLAQWWRRLDDPGLSALIEAALGANTDLAAARARLAEARARLGVAEADRLPAVNASAAAGRAKGSKAAGTGAARDSYKAGLDAAWAPDISGTTRHAIEAARAELAATGADLHAARVAIAAELGLNYVRLRAFEARLTIARANLARQSETLQLTEWRAQAGLNSALDVEQARTSREQTRAQIPVLEAGRAEAAHRLAILVGQPPGAIEARPGAAGRLPAVPERVVTGIPADTLRQRPDVMAAERRLAAASARVGEARAARLPAYALSGSIGLEALSLGALGQGSALARSVLAGVSLPVFDAGRRRQQVAVQEAQVDTARANYEKTVLGALEEVENALSALAQARARGAALGQAAEASRNAALLARHRYTAGLADFQAVLDAERSQLAVEDGLKSSEADAATALIRLYQALGGGWSELPSPVGRGAGGEGGRASGRSGADSGAPRAPPSPAPSGHPPPMGEGNATPRSTKSTS